MKPILNDIRMLKLAEFYEEAYEAFIVEIATKVIDDPEIRTRLMALVSPEDAHAERIVENLERLNAAVAPEDHTDLLRAALLDVRDVEQSARDFYIAAVDRVHDPKVAALFRELANEERGHVRIAEDAIRILERKAHLSGNAEHTTIDDLRLIGEGLPDLREGVSDLAGPRVFRRVAKGDSHA